MAGFCRRLRRPPAATCRSPHLVTQPLIVVHGTTDVLLPPSPPSSPPTSPHPERPNSDTEHPNAQVLRDFFDAFGAADRQRLGELTTLDMVWHFPGHSPISGDWHGIDGVLEGIRATAMALGRGNNGFELLHVYADDRTAVTIHRDYYTADDNDLDLRYVLYVRMSGRKMAEVWKIPFDQAENDRYMAVQARNLALQPKS